MAKATPHVVETTLNMATRNGAKSLTNGAIRISPKIAPTVTLEDIAEGINLKEVAAATMLDINKVIAEEDKKIAPQTCSKTPSLEASDNENPFHEDIPKVISYIPSSNNILDTFSSYHLSFRHNSGMPPTYYSPDYKGKMSKYPISNYVSTKGLSIS
jgi:hypothetical protein